MLLIISKKYKKIICSVHPKSSFEIVFYAKLLERFEDTKEVIRGSNSKKKTIQWPFFYKKDKKWSTKQYTEN